MTDELTITGEVGERWTLTRHAIDRALHELDPDVEYRLGGGTVLAAQWKHRKSYDIDLQVSPVELQRLETSEFDWLKQAVKDWGATTKLYDRAALYEIAFGDGPQAPKLQLWRHDAEFRTGHSTRQVNGEPMTVLSNSQILRGKLERADMALPRDLFDLIAAAREDPKSLSAAANAISQTRVLELGHGWQLRHGRIARNAREQIDGLPEGSPLDAHRLAEAAGQALEDACYRKLQIRTVPEGIEFETATYGGQAETWTTNLKRAAYELEARGIAAHLERQGHRARGLLIAATRSDSSESVTLYAETDAQVTTWLGKETGTRGVEPTHDPLATGAESDHSQDTSGTDEAPKLRPPNPALLSNAGVDHSGDDDVVRNENAGPGGTPRKTEQQTHEAESPAKKISTTYEI